MNLILSPTEIDRLYRAFLDGKVSLIDINESHQAQLLIYAKELNEKASNYCYELAALNPNQDFQFILGCSHNYKDSKNVIDFISNWLDKKQANEQKSLPVKSNNINKTTYKWQGKPNELPKLYSLMRNKYRLIAQETLLEQFTAIFTGQSIEGIQPIKWIKAKNLNAYFIEQLIEIKKINKFHNPKIWDIAKYCFTDGTNFAQLVELYKNNKTGKPKNYKLIDELLKAL